MKLCLVLFVASCLALAHAEPEKRFLIDQLSKWLNLDKAKQTIQTIVDKLGTDTTEAACEKECGLIIHATIIPQTCPFICHKLQDLVKHLHIVPAKN